MNKLLFLFIIIVIVIFAYVLFAHTTGSGELKELKECTDELARIVGGSDKVVSMKVLHKITPYLKEVKATKHVEAYLEKYFDYSTNKLRILRDVAEDDVAPPKYRYLHTLISDIVDKQDMESAEEFFKTSKLAYREFLPAEYKRLLDYAPRLTKIPKQELSKISKIFDKYLTHEGTHIIKSKLLDKTDDLIHSHKLFKFKAGKATLPLKRLKLLIDTDPSKVFELDHVGLIAEMYKRALDSASKAASSYGRKSAEEELRKQIERDTETLRLIRDYPTTTRRAAEAREVAIRLELAAGRVYGDRYARKLLKDLYYDYYPSAADLVYAPGLYGLGRRDAERETRDERDRRIRAESARDESERGRKAAQLAQEQSDRSMAERMTQDDTEQELARERNEIASEKAAESARKREHELQQQLAKAYEDSPAAEKHEMNRQHALQDDHDAELAAANIDVNKPPEGVDPDLWLTMAAHEKRELAKDNIEVLPLIHLN
jgi:hypothetical protein